MSGKDLNAGKNLKLQMVMMNSMPAVSFWNSYSFRLQIVGLMTEIVEGLTIGRYKRDGISGFRKRVNNSLPPKSQSIRRIACYMKTTVKSRSGK